VLLLLRAKLKAVAAAPDPARASASIFCAIPATWLLCSGAPAPLLVLLQLPPAAAPTLAGALSCLPTTPLLSAAAGALSCLLLLLRVSTAEAISASSDAGSFQQLPLTCVTPTPTAAAAANWLLLPLLGNPGLPASLLAPLTLHVLLMLGARLRIAAAMASTSDSLSIADAAAGTSPLLLSTATAALLLLLLVLLTTGGLVLPTRVLAAAALAGAFCKTAAAI
jgi:hypothetical protein